MFGSKIRSWMENHIVRPRKKGNKNKNGTSNNAATANGTQNGHKGNSYTAIYQSDAATVTQAGTTNSISSPARRSEVSPIQNHTTSRFGWQSPKRESAVSPISDHLFYAHNIKSHTLSSSSPLSSTGNTKISPTISYSSKKIKTLSPNNMLRKSSFSFVAQDSDMHSIQKQQCSPKLHQSSHSQQQQQPFQTNSSLSSKPFSSNSSYHKPFTNSNQIQHEINIQNDNRNQYSVNKPNHVLKQPGPDGSKVSTRYQNGSIQNIEENRYGKILPSKRQSLENFNQSVGSYDNINANIPIQTVREDRIHSSNNNNDSISSTPLVNRNDPVYRQQQQLHHMAGQVPCRNIFEGNRNVLRPSRYNGNPTVGASNSHPLAHVINSLSSPESAYSTGYSTDGTSPGATYTPPEYYINIRTGTHYFPKGLNALAIETTRYKFGLKKIEEMSPQDPLPNNHRRTESFDLGQNKIAGFGIPDPTFFKTKNIQDLNSASIPQENTLIHSYKGFECTKPSNTHISNNTIWKIPAPSPRQRCRIRTNPWYNTTDTSSSGNSIFLAKKIEIDASSSSSGIKSSSDAGASDKNEKNEKSSDSETTSSSTEVEAVQRTFSPSTIRRKKVPPETIKSEVHLSYSVAHQDSDEDATLNEMMGKFDESYVYEKETDILSDSDPTDCVSDLDTGQDAGDECDTDDLLDIDFIDNGSIQEIFEKESYKNTGNCSYFNFHLERRSSRIRRSRKQNEDSYTATRKKRLLKTRKKSAENREKYGSPIRGSRESRSLGGTPVCLRRNQSADSKKTMKISPLTNRCSSLTLTEVHAIQGRFIPIAESEKALLKADLEADVKYKQLIHEAETILVSMKTSAFRETPVASPRRVCNPPANKRVEMLRSCEADIKREVIRQQKFAELHEAATIADSILVNKRLEILKQETSSAPNTPKCGRISPRKTHVTNFINQNAPSSEILRRKGIPDMPKAQIQEKRIKGPLKSPSIRRRGRSHSPRVSLYSDSDSEDDLNCKSPIQKEVESKKGEANLHQDDPKTFNEDLTNKNILMQPENVTLYFESDYTNRNIVESKNPSLMSFRSIDIGNRTSTHSYCPQSEPLKRKIYKGSSSFERIKKTLDLESEIPKLALLEKISNLRRERQAQKESHTDTNLSVCSLHGSRTDEESLSSNITVKQQLIFDTIEDLKRSLEDQSVELYGLNDPLPVNLNKP